MSQYLQFRSWLRASAPAEKKLSLCAAALAVGLVSWALVPTGGPATNSVSVGVSASSGEGSNSALSTAGGLGTGSTTLPGGSGSSGGPSTTIAGSSAGSVSVVSGGSGAASTPGRGSTRGVGSTNAPTSASCSNLKSTDTGVSSTQIKVAAVLVNLAGAIGNSAVGQASPQTQQQMFQAVIDDINAHGGVDCRKVVADYYSANPIDPTSTQNACLQIQQRGYFAVLGGFAYPAGANDCLAQQKIPVIASLAPTLSEAKQYYPYLMSVAPDPSSDFKNAIFGLRSRAWFTAAQGFRKIAILEDDCSPEVNQSVYSNLLAAGVPASQIVKNDFSCPSGGFASPSDMSNFATQDSLAHVTNVAVVTGGGSFKEFTNAAQTQNYKPKYLVSNYDGFMTTATGSTGPNPTNFDGMVVTTTSRFGESDTPGLTDPATQACIALFARHGLPASDITGSSNGGVVCNLVNLFAVAASKDSSATRAGLAQALGQVGRFNEAYPQMDSTYGAPGLSTPVTVTGGSFWWTVEFHASCTCFKVIDPTLHPSY